MSDEITQETGSDQQAQGSEQTRSDNRFKDLSDKYAKEAEARKAEAEARVKAEKEVEFYKGFTPLTSKYQAAGEFQDKIKEKVMAGYDVEDATTSVLIKEGRFTQSTTEVARPRENPTGGSAPTTLKSSEKNYAEMNATERRDELIKLEQESGGLSSLFNRTL